MIARLIFILTLSFSSILYAEISPDAGKISLWLRQPYEDDYDCAVFLPNDYDPATSKNYPMILSLHGFHGSVLDLEHTKVGGNRSSFIKQVWNTRLAETYQAIVIAPNRSPPGYTFNALWSHDRLRRLIIDAKKRYKIDPQKIVSTGYSSGSLATQKLLRFSKDLVMAGMPAAFSPAVVKRDVCSAGDLPMWSFGNISDPFFRYYEWKFFRRKIQTCSNYTEEFKLSIYLSFCAHECWDKHWARTDVQEWLINPRKFEDY